MLGGEQNPTAKAADHLLPAAPRAQPQNCEPGSSPTRRYGAVELSGAGRRKNATRETTSTLKAWLNEHRKNPYPTKGEKIMLAIITKMTLTQVSTWFANARRRLKKENKMTWVPKNKGGEERKEDGAAEELLGCLNGDTKGTLRCPAPAWLLQPSVSLDFQNHPLGELLRKMSPTYPCTCSPCMPQGLRLCGSLCLSFPINLALNCPRLQSLSWPTTPARVPGYSLSHQRVYFLCHTYPLGVSTPLQSGLSIAVSSKFLIPACLNDVWHVVGAPYIASELHNIHQAPVGVGMW